MQDQELVAAIVAGDPAGLAAAYDRYASALYAYCRTMLRDSEDAADVLQDTFVVAAQKLGGLRDPELLRPWLYAVARNECLRRVRSRQAQAMVDLDQAGEVSDDAVDFDAGMREADVRGLIWAAIQGLNPSEREVFELSVRHELEGADLAAALGVPANHAHALLSRARGQLEKSLGALLVARTGRQDCAELATILTGWDGELTALLRKRINRHIEQCGVCGERKRRELRPEALLGALPILLLPPGLRSSVLRLVGNVLPGGGGSGNSNGSSSDGSPSRNGASNANTANGIGIGSGIGNLIPIATANAAEYCAQVAKRAEPFDRAGFPVPLDHRRFRPAAAARRKSLIAAALLLLLLLGLGGYTAARFISPDKAAAALPTPGPTPTAIVVDTQSSIQIEIATSPPSPSASQSTSTSPSASPSASPSFSPGPSIVVSASVRSSPPHSSSPSPSRSPSPSPPPPPPPGVLVAAPTFIEATYTSSGETSDYVGEFSLSAQKGAVSSFTITLPTPGASWGYPLADPASHGPMASGSTVTITVTLETFPRHQPVVLTVEPPAPQAPISITVSPYQPIT